MSTSYKVSFSIVLYQQDTEEIQHVLYSLLLYEGEKTIYVIDNSPNDTFSFVTDINDCITYRHMSENVGFGAAHNKAFRMAREYGSKYHFVVNPDISYDKDVVSPMLAFLEEHEDIGQMMPRILYPDGKKQYLPKLLPSPYMLFWRKMKHPLRIHENYMNRFEMRSMLDNRPYDVACVTGCFSAIRTELLERTGGYDERFFMYFEDTDLTRRLHAICRTVYYPLVHVKHTYGHGASKHCRLFFIFISSCLKYFFKWGWFFDSQRRQINQHVLKQIEA